MSTPEPCEQDCLCFYSEGNFVGSIEKYCPDDGIEPGCKDLKQKANSAHNFTDYEVEVFTMTGCQNAQGSRHFFIPPRLSLGAFPGTGHSFRFLLAD